MDEITDEAMPFTGESFDKESLLGEIEHESVGAISATDYIKWVQRSLNRLYRTNLPTDGKISSAYRASVRKFNLEYSGRDYSDVDEQTQNDLIYANEGDKRYVKWIIERLNQVGLGQLPASDPLTTQAVHAIKMFQGRVGLQVKGKQEGDGYVGAKTELALIKATGTLPPGGYVKPGPPKPPNLRALLREVAIDSLGRSAAERSRLRCLQDFLARALAGERLDDRYWQFTIFDGFGRERNCSFTGTIAGVKRVTRPQRALANFKRNCATPRSVPEVGRCLKQVHDAILCHLNALLGWASHNSAMGDAPLRDFPECTWLLDLQAASVRTSPKSIYSCFAPLLRHVREICT